MVDFGAQAGEYAPGECFIGVVGRDPVGVVSGRGELFELGGLLEPVSIMYYDLSE